MEKIPQLKIPPGGLKKRPTQQTCVVFIVDSSLRIDGAILGHVRAMAPHPDLVSVVIVYVLVFEIYLDIC